MDGRDVIFISAGGRGTSQLAASSFLLVSACSAILLRSHHSQKFKPIIDDDVHVVTAACPLGSQ